MNRTSTLRRGMAIAVTAAAVTIGLVPTAAAAEGVILGAGASGAIEGSYLVVLKDGMRSAGSVAANHSASVTHTYTAAVRGFSARMSAADARRLAADPAVAYVEQDRVVQVVGTQPNPPSWGLDRIDQAALPLDNSYTYPNTAPDVTAYIIDTGIRTSHADFGGRASWGTNTADTNDTDCNGHGTHVAGTVGGGAHGVAKDVRLVAVKVLNCAGSGTLAGVTAGVDWVTANAVKPAVANMSLGASGSNATLEAAVRNSIASGVTYALASGNSNADACNFTPARTPEAITVNASTSTDLRASFSNFGTCSDIFAPGQGITAPWNTSDTSVNTISGTSMASPHVAGAAALYLQANQSATGAQVQQALKAAATQGVIGSPGTGSPNLLLNVGDGGPGPQPCDGLSAWNSTTEYVRGAMVTHVGHAWELQANRTTGKEPGTWSRWADRGPC